MIMDTVENIISAGFIQLREAFFNADFVDYEALEFWDEEDEA